MSFRTTASAIAFALAAVSMAAPASAEVLTGKTLKIEWLFPDLSTVFEPAQDITGGGQGVTILGGGMTVTLGANKIITDVNHEVDFDFSVPRLFNGLHIWDAYDSIGPIELVTLFHADDGFFFPSQVQFDQDNIFIRFGGVLSPGAEVDLGVAAGAPEPAAWTLMIGGFGLAGAALRRRHTATAAV